MIMIFYYNIKEFQKKNIHKERERERKKKKKYDKIL